MAQTLKLMLVRLIVWVATFLCRLVIAVVLLLLITVVCALLPFMGTRVAGHFLAKAVETLTDYPL